MARVQVTLWDADGQVAKITDDDQAGEPFIDLNVAHQEGLHAQGAQVDQLENYVLGDHAVLLATPERLGTDQIVLDPSVTQAGVHLDLHNVDEGFADRTQAVVFVLNQAGVEQGAWARVVLLNKNDQWNFPSMVFYPFESAPNHSPPGKGPGGINLEQYFFSQKVHQARVDSLGNPSGVVYLLDQDLEYTQLDPGPAPDLHQLGWQDRAWYLQFNGGP